MKKYFRSKRGEIFSEILVSVLLIGILTASIFQAVLLMRELVQKANQIDTYAAAAQTAADTIGTALWGTGFSNDELSASSFAVSQTEYARIDGISGAKHVSSFSYDPDNPVQYTLTPKTESITEYGYSESGYTSNTREIVTGLAVRVRVYYGDSEGEYTEASLFSNIRGGDVHVL